MKSSRTWISIHAPREGGDTENLPGTLNIDISIHAPREGGDPGMPADAIAILKISIHAPREGGDLSIIWDENVFLISIHAPREGGDPLLFNKRPNMDISIHAPREGGDDCSESDDDIVRAFQSTPPARGAT